MRIAAPLLTLLLLTGCGSGNPSDDIDIRLRPQKGSSYRLRTRSEQQVQGGPLKFRQTINMSATYDILEVTDDGRIVMRFTCDSISYMQESEGVVMKYHSADTGTDIPEPAMGYAAMVGTGFAVTVTPDGRVVGLGGTDSMRALVLSRIHRENQSLKGFLETTMMNLLADSSLRESIEESFAFYPDHMVGVGDSWERRLSVSRSIPVVVDNQYEFAERTGTGLRLSVEADVASNATNRATGTGPLAMHYEISGSQKGTITIDPESGWITGSDITQQLEGFIVYPKSDESAVDMRLPVSIVSTVKQEGEMGITK